MKTRAAILLVEDEESDILIFQRTFSKAQILNPLIILESSEEAMHYLNGDGKYSNREEFPFPSLALLDLKLPRIDGYELLQWIRGQKMFQSVRLVALTGFEDERAVTRALECGADAVLTKPLDLKCLVQASQMFGGFWTWSPAVEESEAGPLKEAA